MSLIVMVGIFTPLLGLAETIQEKETRLQAELSALEEEIKKLSVFKVEKSRERTTLERDIAILEAQIEETQLSIRHRTLTLGRIGADIDDKEEAVRLLDEKVSRQRDSLAQLLRRTREIDDLTLVEIALSGSVSELFADIDNFEIIQRSLDDSFKEILLIKQDLGARTRSLEEKYREEARLRELQVLQRQEIEAQEVQKQEILDITKGEEETYQQLISEREKTAAEIRSALFSLRDTSDISFGEAYDFAKAASAVTGVRPAFVLGILKNESDLGRNVGQCFLTNSPEKGDGVGKNTGRHFVGVMKPTRDVDPFMQISSELGFDPFSQVVSCPQSVGFGGAMGPAQFIPSTWILYKDRIAKATGENPPNPWNPRTAFFASSLFLSDLGADKGGRASEREAALRYFAGGGWRNPAFASYGDRVLGFADEFQRQIDILENN